MLGYHRRLPVTGHCLLALRLTSLTILSQLRRASQLAILPNQKDEVALDLSSYLQVTRQNLEGPFLKRAYANADRRSAWVDQVLERVRWLSERGIPRGDIDCILKKPNVALRLGKTSIVNLDATFQYYRSLNFQDVNMGCLLRKCPNTWLTDIEGGLKLKVEFLESIGFRGPDLEKLIANEPHLLAANLHNIRNVVEFLRSLAMDEPSLCMMIRRCPNLLLHAKVEQILKPRLESLRGAGFTSDELTFMLVRRPQLLQYSFDDNTSKKFDLFLEFGIERNTRAFVLACVRLLTISIEQLRARFDFLLSLGFSHDEVRKLLRRQPGILSRREDGIGLKVAYAINVMGRSLQTIVVCPGYLILSLEDRIKPRYEAFQRWKMQTGGKDYSFNLLFTYSNDRFLQQFKGCSLHARVWDGE